MHKTPKNLILKGKDWTKSGSAGRHKEYGKGLESNLKEEAVRRQMKLNTFHKFARMNRKRLHKKNEIKEKLLHY